MLTLSKQKTLLKSKNPNILTGGRAPKSVGFFYLCATPLNS